MKKLLLIISLTSVMFASILEEKTSECTINNFKLNITKGIDLYKEFSKNRIEYKKTCLSLSRYNDSNIEELYKQQNKINLKIDKINIIKNKFEYNFSELKSLTKTWYSIYETCNNELRNEAYLNYEKTYLWISQNYIKDKHPMFLADRCKDNLIKEHNKIKALILHLKGIKK